MQVWRAPPLRLCALTVGPPTLHPARTYWSLAASADWIWVRCWFSNMPTWQKLVVRLASIEQTSCTHGPHSSFWTGWFCQIFSLCAQGFSTDSTAGYTLQVVFFFFVFFQSTSGLKEKTKLKKFQIPSSIQAMWIQESPPAVLFYADSSAPTTTHHNHLSLTIGFCWTESATHRFKLIWFLLNLPNFVTCIHSLQWL